MDSPASSPLRDGNGRDGIQRGRGELLETAPNSGCFPLCAFLYSRDGLERHDRQPTVCWPEAGARAHIYPKPTWQTGTGVPNDGARDVPDLSLNASPRTTAYLICVQGSCVNGFRNPNNPTLANALTVAGGTSAAAPTFAGIVALIDQSTGSPQGNINPILYPDGGELRRRLFTTSPPATTWCPARLGLRIAPPAARQIGYNAGAGYDQASGLGRSMPITWSPCGTQRARETCPRPP